MTILLGSLACVLTFFGVMLLSAMLILTSKNPLVYTDTFSPLAFAVAGALSGLIGRKMLGIGNLFPVCPALVLLLSLLAGLFLSGGKIAPSALLSEMIYLGSACLFFYLSKNGRKKGMKRHR